MDSINSLELLDGNIYEVKLKSSDNADRSDNVTGTSFDKIFNDKTVTESLEDIFNDASERYGVDVKLLKAVAYAESDFKTDAVSKSGAQGIMQLMPYTSKELGVEDPFDARQNIMGGAKLLSILLEEFGGNITLAVAGYNAGANAVSSHGGVPPYEQTLKYIDNINYYLNGALSNDSRTINGSKATDLSGVTVASADIYVATKSETADLGNYSDVSSSVITMISEDGSVTAYNPTLLRFEDYLYVCSRYQQIFEKLAQSIASSDIAVNSSVMTQMMTGTIQGVLENDRDVYEGQDSVFSVLNSKGNAYNTIRADLDAFENAIFMNSMNSFTGSKVNPKELYEASVSYGNPLISKLLDL